jgi:Tfp pilus assembly protein PilN
METAIDFLPERLKVRRALRSRIFRQVNLLLLAAGTFAAWIYFSDRRVSQANAELAILKDRSANAQRLVSQRGELQGQLGELLIKDRISGRLGTRAGPLDVLAELERLMPPGVSLTSFTLDGVKWTPGGDAARDRGGAAPPGASAKEPAVNRLQVILTGIAPHDVDVATFIGQITASPLFEDVNMSYTRGQVIQGRRAREFQVSCNVIR